jgi:hypothetical protein
MATPGPIPSGDRASRLFARGIGLPQIAPDARVIGHRIRRLPNRPPGLPVTPKASLGERLRRARRTVAARPLRSSRRCRRWCLHLRGKQGSGPVRAGHGGCCVSVSACSEPGGELAIRRALLLATSLRCQPCAGVSSIRVSAESGPRHAAGTSIPAVSAAAPAQISSRL